MSFFFVGVVVADAWWDGSLLASVENKPIQATGLCVLIALLAIPAQIEMSKLAASKGFKIFTPITIVASILLAISWYVTQFDKVAVDHYAAIVIAITLLALFLRQAMAPGSQGVIANCGASLFSVIYLGVLSGFVLGIRVEYGIWPFLMFICVIKSSDIGAYTIGRLFGKHKFSPRISPKKTWEGMAGAVVFASIVAVAFSVSCDIMVWWLAVVFGFCFAFIGQLSDLAESMIKRDAQQKDSADNVPGFGGVLDIIDSPLGAAVFGYLFFSWCC